MKFQVFGNDYSLNGQTVMKGFSRFVAIGLVVGVVRALLEPMLPYADVDWKVQAVSPSTTASPRSPDTLSSWAGDLQNPPATPDPLASTLRGMSEPSGVLLPKLQLPITPKLAFSQFYLGRDLSTCFCSGEAGFQVEWEDCTYTARGIFLDLSEPLENVKLLCTLDTLDRLYRGGIFQTGPGPRIAGYEQAGDNFRFVVGELQSPISNLASLSYGRNTDWLSFPSKFAPPQSNPNGPWSIYAAESIYPWLGVDLISNFSGGSITASALTHAIDFDAFPIEWQEPLPATEYQWLENNSSWHTSSKQLVETFSNYQAGLVVAAVQSSRGRSALLLFSAHDNRLLAVRKFPLSEDRNTDRYLTRLNFGPDGMFIAGYDNLGELFFFHTKTLQLLRHYDQVDGRSSRHKTVRLAFNARGDRFIAPARDSGDLIEIDFINNRLLRLNASDPVSAFCYVTSFDEVDTLMTVSAAGGRIIKYRLDDGTAAREENFLLAGLYPHSTYLNFSETGTYLLGTASEAFVDHRTAPEGKSIATTQSRLLVWDLTSTEQLAPVPSSIRAWSLRSGGMVRGQFIKLDRRVDGWHVLVNDPQYGLVDIPSGDLSNATIDQAILLSSVVRPPDDLAYFSPTGVR